MYKVERNNKYDFAGQSYASVYPNLHKYPATMLPQIGIEILKELGIKKGLLLDPYCGSGSSFASGLECGITEMYGYDINPLAVLISKVKFTKTTPKDLLNEKTSFRDNIFDLLKNERYYESLNFPQITNIEFWFSNEVINKLALLKHCIENIEDINIRDLFYIPFSETVRECSYTRNNEFKLFRMKSEDLLHFNPDVISVYLNKLNETILIYNYCYFPKLKDNVKVDIKYSAFNTHVKCFDVVLTSPPYGDSRTTVAYGQFSTLSNEWMGFNYARKIDGLLMGGNKLKHCIQEGLIADYIAQINKIDSKRALEVSSFYEDLNTSIQQVAKCVNSGGKSIYVVGNRTVKNVLLPTDQFIAEKFEENGFKHLVTYERALSNKSMPCRNSPTNKTGKTVNTMMWEYIVVCEKQ
ncbi:MAG: modification methylase [Candidatus Cloacimonetes bacterium]|nr:modification methylase [Candidatus Cloacimonadota bacterium]